MRREAGPEPGKTHPGGPALTRHEHTVVKNQVTSDAPFRVTPDEQVQVPMMSQVYEFRYGEGDGLQVLELPYAGDDLSMVNPV
jgi:serine protease inhibitor